MADPLCTRVHTLVLGRRRIAVYRGLRSCVAVIVIGPEIATDPAGADDATEFDVDR